MTKGGPWLCGVAALGVLAFGGPVGWAPPGLFVANFSRTGTGQFVIKWAAETNSFGNLFFTVEGGSNLASGFSPISPLIDARLPRFLPVTVTGGSNL